MASTSLHVSAIHELFRAAEQAGILLWLGNGWAVDAMLGWVTREHEDIDVVYDFAEEERVRLLLESLGYVVREWTDYGFILDRDGVELDMDKCVESDGGYTFEDYPPGCCPLEPNGLVEGLAVRCTAWEALYLEMLYNQRDIPAQEWRAKDIGSFQIIAAQFSEERRTELRAYDAETWGRR
jgi:2''-aminoglycoside nucleotidyltransferase